MIVNSITPSIVFKGNNGTPKVPHHAAPKAATVALLGTLATVTGCPVDYDPDKKPPITVDPNPPTATATATSTATEVAVNDGSPANVYMNKLKAAGIVPKETKTYEGSSWFDNNALTSVAETVTKSDANSSVIHGVALIPGAQVEYDNTLTTNPDGSTELVKTVNGRPTEEYRVTTQVRDTRTFADFQCIKGDCFDYSLSADIGKGNVYQYGDGNFKTPIDVLSSYKVRVNGQEPTLVERAVNKVRFITRSNGITIEGIASNVPTMVTKFSKLA